MGYFNLRGWGMVIDQIDALPAQKDLPSCRLIVGMRVDTERAVHQLYAGMDKEMTNEKVMEKKRELAKALRRQLTWGLPTLSDERALGRLARQLRQGTLQVRFFGAYPLHAKLYLAYHNDTTAPVTGYVGSSNLTLAGLEKQGELNLDILDRDTTATLVDWFEERWEHKWCIDISNELAKIIEESWAGGPVKPYEIYVKTAYELSREAVEGAVEFKVPRVFDKVLAEFQKQAVTLAAERLNRHGGVMVSDVVGLGKTLVACAIAKIYQEDHGGNLLVICPPKIENYWKGELHRYELVSETLSLGKTHTLKNERRYRLIIIDESHNLRNRETSRWAHVQNYIYENDSRVILLTATPYNAKLEDIGSQLRLFVDPEKDLGISPEKYINNLKGIDNFMRAHPNAPSSSLIAFEHSEYIDDWRELMGIYMVRRTREHIKRNYAEYDKKRKRHYFFLGNNERRYFPHREPHCIRFHMDDNDVNDQYAMLYTKHVVDIINGLELPRYGIGKYWANGDNVPNNKNEKKIYENLSRAGQRLRGFARSNLFKRLESSGPAFLLSIRRHILRNAIYLVAIDAENGEFPIGSIISDVTDLAMEEEGLSLLYDIVSENDLAKFMEAGSHIYDNLRNNSKLRKRFDWIAVHWFNEEGLKNALNGDNATLMDALQFVPAWKPEDDRKLDALHKACSEDHGKDKILIFTQFKDTADYLCNELRKRKLTGLAMVHGGTENAEAQVCKFSPCSNDKNIPEKEQLRILLTTDTLSEGQNLQDAHIIINFDLPWAIIRLVQRAGRVDRIGQKSDTIYCYCFLPEDGIEHIINLRGRLNKRIEENAELVGSDEKFFEGNKVNLKQVYEESLNLDQEDDETDLISRAYDIYQHAIKTNQGLEKRIKSMPDVVYSAKHYAEIGGALAYIKTHHAQHILAQVNEKDGVVSQSQSRILDMLACEPDEPIAKVPDEHHSLVATAVKCVRSREATLGGQLGGERNIRNKVYTRLSNHLDVMLDETSNSAELKEAINLIYKYPLREIAREKLQRQVKTGINDHDLATIVRTLMGSDSLCVVPKSGESTEPHIVCSMGLVKE